MHILPIFYDVKPLRDTLRVKLLKMYIQISLFTFKIII